MDHSLVNASMADLNLTTGQWLIYDNATPPYLYELLNATSTNDTDVEDHYPGAEALKAFNQWYRPYHGYLAAFVCVFGIVANILNIIVLTRKNMISATNCILTGLAVSDGLTMVSYLPFALHFYVLYGNEPTLERNTLPAARYMLFFACFSVVVHTVSIWLTVTLAVFRYIFIRWIRRGAVLCSLSRAKLAVVLVYVITLIACIPNFISITIKGMQMEEMDLPLPPNVTAGNDTIVWIVSLKYETPTDKMRHSINIWIQALIVKLFPCLGLTILSVLLVRTMRRAEQRRQQLLNKGAKSRLTGPVTNGALKEVTEIRMTSPAGGGGGNSSKDRRTNRTTVMLLTVVALFLLTEFPQGILHLLSVTLPRPFADDIYLPLGDLMDILALINNGVNFILYCTMSKQFRDTFMTVSNIPGADKAF